jgi:hypothetical protein
MCLKRMENAALGLATVGLVLFVANAALILDSQAKQREIGMRSAQIQDGQRLAGLNNELVSALGAAVIEKKDTKIKDMLAEHGITVQQNKNGAKPAAPAAAPQQ